MAVDLSFNGVCKFIKNDLSGSVDDIDTVVDLLLSAFVLLSGNPFAADTSTIHSFADVFTSKGKLSKICKTVIEKITEKKDKHPLSRLERMEYVYGLICYMAFFEALDHKALFFQILMEGRTKSEDKHLLSQTAREGLESSPITSTNLTQADGEPSTVSFGEGLMPVLPHPEESFDRQAVQLLPLYQALTKGFLSFLECLAVYDTAEERRKTEIKIATASLPQESLKAFKAQYFLLAAKYEEFYIWSNLHEHEKPRTYLGEMSEYTQKYAGLKDASKRVIDIGFQLMAETFQAIPEQIESRNINIALKELAMFYTSTIEKPIIDDPNGGEEGRPTLRYPKRSEIFIPQAFKVIRHTGREPLSLENENTWYQLPTRNDLGAFLLSYLSSPYSTFSPLIILGSPGSGKSLLTSILAARLISSPYTPIKIELRSVNAEAIIPKQIEDQIYKDTSRKIEWTRLSDHFKKQPPLILLDGYDEFLQLSDKVFSGYLRALEQFQQNQISIERSPVRTVVTSRITLIDKAIIPAGATIIRLLEFDQEKQNKWISVWNTANRQYFQQAQTEPFELPQNNKIVPLAERPLLLLMLALYDAGGNPLRKQKGLDQTLLCDNLLRRFIMRERMKDESFASLTQKEQDKTIERDMEQLGVAAIGMFNRRSLFIIDV